MSDVRSNLSRAGAERRRQMLAVLLRRLARRRRARRAGGGAALAAILASALWLAADRPHRGPPLAAPVAQPAAGPAMPRLECAVVHDDPGIVERSAASDAELMAFLAEARRPAGLARIGGRVLVIEAAGSD